MNWINVNELLPDCGENGVSKKVLLVNDKGEFAIGYYRQIDQTWIVDNSYSVNEVKCWSKITHPGKSNKVPDSLINLYRNIEFKLIERCRIKVGGDNTFWDDVSLSNLPRNKYLQKMLVDFLNEDYEIRNLKMNKEEGVIQYVSGYHNSYSASTPEKIYEKKFHETGIYDDFLIYIGQMYDYELYKISK